MKKLIFAVIYFLVGLWDLGAAIACIIHPHIVLLTLNLIMFVVATVITALTIRDIIRDKKKTKGGK